MHLLTYFILTFIISWGGLLILGLPYGFPASQKDFAATWPIVFIPYLLGPFISCIATTFIFQGKEGWKYLGNLFRGTKIPLLVPLLSIAFIPLVVIIVLLIFSIFNISYLPEVFSDREFINTIIIGLSVGLIGGGFLEEPGWTGYATNKLKIRNIGFIKTGVIIGLVWGIWHILPTVWGSGDKDGVFSPMLLLPPLVFYVGVLPSYRLIMTVVFYRYSNIYISILMHMSLTATTLFILVPNVSGMELIYYYMALTLLLSGIGLVLVKKVKNLAST